MNSNTSEESPTILTEQSSERSSLSMESPPDCVAIGTYDASKDSITYDPDWREQIESHLDTFRLSLSAQQRDKLRETIAKPQKQRKATRTPRKTTTRTKSTTST